jgi:hypothetical protein
LVKFQSAMLNHKMYSFPSFTLKVFIYLLFVLDFAVFTASAREKEKPLTDAIYSDNIKTVKFYREGWDFSLPILELGSNQRVVLKFDELTDNIRNYSYTITHCDFDWFPSRLIPAEYLDGFIDNPINDHTQSINTTIPYVNYLLAIPNDNIKLLVSGNYLLTVFEEGKRDTPILTRRFYVVEPSSKISGMVKKATFDAFKGPNQEVDFMVECSGISMQDPRNEVKVVLMQNSRYDNAITNLKPLNVRNNQLIYDYNQENVFAGGNEFRNFDAKNIRINGMGVAKTEFIQPLYHVTLRTDEPRRNEDYRFENDLNGRYLVKNDRANDPDLESDYIFVHFSLEIPEPLLVSDIYIFGELSVWQCNASNKMTYNPALRLYEGTMLLKQGFYDYQYVCMEKGSQKIDNNLLEGSHVETENDYQIFVYHRSFSARYDHLIGFRTINSVKREN